MPALAAPYVTVHGQTAECVELLEDCTPLLSNPDALRQQMAENGYVFLPGFLGRERVTAARRVFIDFLDRAGALVPGHDPMDGMIRPGVAGEFVGGRLEQMFENWKPVHDVLYTGPMIEFFEAFFDERVRHYDYTWTRRFGPGHAAQLHSDVVYMGRGTHELYTAWTPFGDNGFDLGGLILLEGSNNHKGLAKSYFKRDVDAFCENKPDSRAWGKSWATNGSLHGTPDQIRRSLGGRRWLTAEYKMGDVLLFNVYTVHGGTDNRTDARVRLSSDSRYQRASASADERWIGVSPRAHGPESKRSLIC